MHNTSQDFNFHRPSTNQQRKIVFDDDEDINVNFGNGESSDDDLMDMMMEQEEKQQQGHLQEDNAMHTNVNNVTTTATGIVAPKARMENNAPPPPPQQKLPPQQRRNAPVVSASHSTNRNIFSPQKKSTTTAAKASSSVATSSSTSTGKNLFKSMQQFAFKGDQSMELDQLRNQNASIPKQNTSHQVPSTSSHMSSADLFASPSEEYTGSNNETTTNRPVPRQEPSSAAAVPPASILRNRLPPQRSRATSSTANANQKNGVSSSVREQQQRQRVVPPPPPQQRRNDALSGQTTHRNAPVLPPQRKQSVTTAPPRLPPQNRPQNGVQFSLPPQRRSHQSPQNGKKRPRSFSNNMSPPKRKMRSNSPPSYRSHKTSGTSSESMKDEPGQDFEKLLLKPTQQGSQHEAWDEEDDEIDAEDMMHHWEMEGRLVCGGPLRDMMLAEREHLNPGLVSPNHQNHDPSQKQEERDNFEKYFRGKSRKRIQEYIDKKPKYRDNVVTIQQVLEDPDIYCDQVPYMHLINVRFNHTQSTSELYWVTLADPTGTIDAVIPHDLDKKTRDHLLDTGVAMLLQNVNLLHIAPQKFCIVIGKKTVLRLASPYNMPRLIFKLKNKRRPGEHSQQSLKNDSMS